MKRIKNNQITIIHIIIYNMFILCPTAKNYHFELPTIYNYNIMFFFFFFLNM